MPWFSARLEKNRRSESSSGPPHQTSPPAAAVLLAAQSKTTFASESCLYTEGDSCCILQNVTCGVQVNHICTLQVNHIFGFQTLRCCYICRGHNIKKISVLRETARVTQQPTNPPTGHRMSQQGLAQNDQKCQFQAKFGHFWAKNPFFLLEKSKVLLPI